MGAEEREPKWEDKGHVQPYIEYHAKRFNYLAALVERLNSSRDAVVLDVGPGPLTDILRRKYTEVWTLGFASSGIFEGPSAHVGLHVNFDLNGAGNQQSWPKLPRCDLILFSEVIEHLFCDPADVLRFLAFGLKPAGLLVCTTPNLAAVHKRIRAAIGLSPWERWDSGHVTEYTKVDLAQQARRAGLRVVVHEYANYFGVTGSLPRRLIGEALDVVTGVIPSWRRGQVFVLARR